MSANDYDFEIEDDNSVTTRYFKFTIFCNREPIIRLNLHYSELEQLDGEINRKILEVMEKS